MHPGIDRSGFVVACARCGQQNRLRYEQLGDRARCARCKAPLEPPAEPVAMPSGEMFDGLIAGAAVPVLVDFWAEWCKPCHMVAPEVAKVAASRQGRLVVVKIDTEHLVDVARRWRIQSLPTLALFTGGREVARLSGARPASAIAAFVDQHTARA